MKQDDYQEDNIHRLIQASYTLQPSPEEEMALYRQLAEFAEKTGDAGEFPWQAALALSTLLLVLAGWMLYQVPVLSGSAAGPGLLLAGALVLFNLVVLPFAGITIISRRRHA